MKLSIGLLFLAACSSSSGGNAVDAGKAVDGGQVFMDAPPTVPSALIVSGTATQNGESSSSPQAGAAIAFFSAANDTMLGSATSGSDGTYSISITTNGAVVDGYLKATFSGLTDSYTYPPGVLIANTEIDASMITTTDFGLLGGVAGQSSSLGFVAVTVDDASGSAVTGATISSSPASGKYTYTSGGLPTGTTATASDGQGYFINAPIGALTITAAKTGITFKSHVIKTRAGAFTNTTITP